VGFIPGLAGAGLVLLAAVPGHGDQQHGTCALLLA
jgi:hypothetical protein